MANSSVVGLLKVVLSADTAAFNTAMQKSEGMAAEFARSGQKLASSLETSHQKIVYAAHAVVEAMGQMQGKMALTANEAKNWQAKISSAMDVLKAEGKPIEQAFVKAHTALGSIVTQGEKAGGVVGLLKNQFVQMAAAFSGAMLVDRAVSGIVGLGRDAFLAGGQIKDLSMRLGVSTDAIQEWSFAAGQSGASIEDVTLAVTQMNNRLATGDKSTVTALKLAGLEFASIRAMKPEDAFNAVTSAIDRIHDPMVQTQVAMDLFGKGGAKILAMIKDDMAENIANAPKMSEATIEGLDKAEDAWRSFYQHLVKYSGDALVSISNVSVASLPGMAMKGASLWADIFNYRGTSAANEKGFNALMQAVPRLGVLIAQVKGADEALQEFNDANGTGAQQLAKVQAEIDKTAASLARGAEKVAESLARLEEEYQKYARELLTGVSDAQRQQAEWQTRMVREGHGIELAIIKGTTAAYSALAWAMRGAIEARKVLGDSPLPRQMWGVSDQNIGDFMAMQNQGNLLAGRSPITALTPHDFDSVGKALKTQFLSAASELPKVLARAIINGQGIPEALRATFVQVGGDLGETWGKSLAKSGSALSGALGSIFGAAAGVGIDLLMQGLETLINFYGGNNTKKAREGLASSLGLDTTAELYDRLRAMGESGARLADIGLNKIGRNDTIGNAKWMADVKAFMASFTKSLDDAGTKIAAFGMKAPAALRPMIADLLKSTQLTEGLRSALDDINGETTWQEMEDAANKYGIAIDGLGAKFQQNKLGSQFDDIFTAFTRLTEGGVDPRVVLEGMSDEVQALMTAAMKFGTSLPEFMRPMLEQMVQMGLLTDSAGNKLDDLSRFKFTDSIESSFEKMRTILEEIRDLLAYGLPQAARVSGNVVIAGLFAPRTTPIDAASDFAYPTGEMPGFAQGTMGKLLNFGAGTPVALHGWEGVYTAQDLAATGTSGGTMTVQLIQDGRRTAEVVVPWLPGAVKRYGLNR